MYREFEFIAVAWVPWSWDPEVSRAGHPLAMAWALQQAADVGATPVMRVQSHAHDWLHPSQTHAPYAQVATIVTDRGHGASGPTLIPSAHSSKLVAGGMGCADGHPLVVEEHPALPLSAWAAELGAVNLRTGTVDDDTRDPEHAERARRLTSSLYNGWTSLPGSSAAKHWMPQLAADGMTWADFVGTILAVTPQHVEEKAMLRYAPRAWKNEIEARTARNLDRSLG